MQCHSVEKRLQELLDDRLDPAFDFELNEHAWRCADCRALLEGSGQLFKDVEFTVVPGLSDDFSQRVVAAVVSQRRQPTLRFAPVAAFLAIVATLLLVVALGPRQQQTIGPADDLHAVALASSDQHLDASLLGLSIADFDSREVRMAFEHLMAQLTSEGAHFYQVDQLAGTIRPLAATLNVAFDAIRRSIPGRREPLRSEPQTRDLRAPVHNRFI